MVRRSIEITRALLCVSLVAVATGCSSLDSFVAEGFKPVSGKAATVESFWFKQVQFVPDPLNQGMPTPAISGFVFFYPAQPTHSGTSTAAKPAQSVAVEGDLIVEMYDDTMRASGQQPKPLDRIVFPAAVLATRQQVDPNLGLGYSISFPWSSYNRDVKQVHFVIRFEPADGGAPLMSSSSIVHLEHGSAPRAASAIPAKISQP